MSKRTHTIGPWQIMPEKAGRSYIRVRGTVLGERYKIANVITPAEGFADWELEEVRANARLIAAAPDLLAALKLHIDYEETPTDRGGKDGTKGRAWAAFVAARDAAIALAEGGGK